ncbi:DUF6665 family protein [Caulobacter sp. 17J80-11]|uniref:DUF6665 family protein n=1 Tax=Caulobacter sp. 17J80-11 TaxID=2763502 RepID=UPI001653862E|nr:DUF6665 family protein [Caulobacter sp. 17J80-11]MBC6981989.1 hypothetical protein [Caulobacter sp. 17J80-11]
MSLRMPQNLSNQLQFETGASILDAEILAERAAALGRAGRKVEQAMVALKAAASGDAGPMGHAAEAVYEYFILRELSGFCDHSEAIEAYQIPRAVIARLGAR